MPPTCLPESPAFVNAAEEAAWRALRDGLPDDATLLANVWLTDPSGDHEADLVVLWPGIGVAVVEVKGGLVRADRGRWRQHDRDGAADIDPVAQARRSKYALLRYVRSHTSMTALRIGHLVALPYSPVPTDVDPPDCPRWMVLDQTDLATGAAARVAAALRALEGPAPLDAGQADAIARLLTGRPGAQRDLVDVLQESEAEVDRLTQHQAAILEALRHNRRIEVRGGAGTGKTFLAVEQARRLARTGQRVGFVCYSRGLATFAARRFAALSAQEQPAYVGTFHGLGVRWGTRPADDAPQSYWDDELPAEMQRLAAHLTDTQKLDAVVVDEAQDFADSWWPALLAGLRDPDRGGVYVFADAAQRVFRPAGRPPGSYTSVVLDENLRNTRQIAQTFGSLAAEQMRYRGLDGPPVRFVGCPTDEAIARADDMVDALLGEGWPPGAVALLTTHHRHPVHQERLAHRGQAGYWDSLWEDDDAFYGHVLGFKGLERPAVVLAVDGFRDPSRAREMLYVGLSRARDLLVVCGDPEVIHDHGGEGVYRRLTHGVVPDDPR